MLSHLTEFDLNGNPIEDVQQAVDSLQTISVLKALRINLHEEEQVDYLLRKLEGLEELNGLAVERDALFNEDEEEDAYGGEVVNNAATAAEGMQHMQQPGGGVMSNELYYGEEDYENGQAIEEEDQTQEEQFDDANDHFINPSNIVLEESNEDGTISNDNYGNQVCTSGDNIAASQSMI